jgi:MarR family transcriptional regulator, organic hydroperoxide resistance regulator
MVLVAEAVHSLSQRDGVTINAIAHEIGIDQSGASRLVRSAVGAGYLRMTAARIDGRRREVSITPAGISMLDDAHQWQEKVFAALTTDWTEQQRNDFQRAMVSLMERSHVLDPVVDDLVTATGATAAGGALPRGVPASRRGA